MNRHTTTTYPERATEPGALDGHRVDCSVCGYLAKSSVRNEALRIGRGHALRQSWIAAGRPKR